MPEFDLILRDCRLFTADPSQPLLTNAALVISQGKIEWLGDNNSLPDNYLHNAKQVIEKPSGLITPGFIDCHTHLVYGGNRADEFQRQLAGESYQQIAAKGGGILSSVRATRQADKQTLFKLASGRLQSWLKQGVTHIEIKSGYGLDLKSELTMLAVAEQLAESYPIGVSRTLLAAHTLPPEYQDNPKYPTSKAAHQAYIEHIIEVILPAVQEYGAADAVDAFCESIAFNTEQVERLFLAAKQADLAIKLHAEQLSNQQGSLLAAKMGALSVDHLEYLDEPSIKAMAESGTIAVLLPAAFYFLKETRLPPIELLRHYQVPMAVATDHNPGTAPVMSLPLMLNMSCRLFGLLPEEALMGVTSNAARALGLEQIIGSISVGKQADLVCWPVETIDDLVYYFGDYRPHWILKQGQTSQWAGSLQ